MASVQEIYEYINTFAPFAEALDFDNPGLLVGDGGQTVKTALLALDITAPVVEEAVQKGTQLIVSHHPVIFAPLRKLKKNSVPWLLAQHDLSAICAHTNLDMASDSGVNVALSQALGMVNCRGICPHGSGYEAMVGELPEEMESDVFARHVKESLHCGGIRFVPGNRKVKTVGLCSGAGADYLEPALEEGADAFVTGEVKHHQFLLARELGATLVEGGHFHTETVVLPLLTEKLKKAFPQIHWLIAEANTAPEDFC